LSRRRTADDGVDGLAFVRSEGRDVDEGRDFGMPARLSDHHAAVRVTDQDRRTFLFIEDQIGRDHVALQRDGRILDDAYGETVLLEDVVDAGPTRAVDEGAVNQNDVVDPSHDALLEAEASAGSEAPNPRVPLMSEQISKRWLS
jgi:hypothetical protein